MLLLNRVGGNMAHFAKLDSNNVVLEVIVISNEDVDANGGDYSVAAENWVKSKWDAYAWKQCSYNHNQRGVFPGSGFTWDSSKNKFFPPNPYPSTFSLNSDDVWAPDIGFHKHQDGKLADGTDVVVEDIRWDDDNERWLGTYGMGRVDTNDVPFVWNPSTDKWDRL